MTRLRCLLTHRVRDCIACWLTSPTASRLRHPAGKRLGLRVVR